MLPDLEGCCRSGVRPRTGVFACALLGGLAEFVAGPATTGGARLRVPDKEGLRKRCQSIGEEF